jgi:hypothetical protein
VTHKERGYGGKTTCNLFLCLCREYAVTVNPALSFNFAKYNANQGEIFTLGKARNKYKFVFCLKYAKEQSYNISNAPDCHRVSRLLLLLLRSVIWKLGLPCRLGVTPDFIRLYGCSPTFLVSDPPMCFVRSLHIFTMLPYPS